MYHIWMASLFLFHQAVQQEVATKQPEFDSLAVSAPHLQATQAKLENSATQLNTRYTNLKAQAKVGDIVLVRTEMQTFLSI